MKGKYYLGFKRKIGIEREGFMKKEFLKKLLTVAVLSALTLTACASAKKEMNMADSAAPQENYESSLEAEYYGEGKFTGATQNDSAVDLEEAMPDASTVGTNTPAQTQDKIIKRVSMTLETRNFDELITTINDKIEVLGGYVESSSINGNRYYYSDETRQGRIVARIPQDRLDEFTGTVGDVAHVVNSEMNTENVTLKYVDMESRLKALQIEQERLFALLEKEDTLDDIIILESRLSDIRYELQNYESQLRTMDNQVQYSTVTLTIYEVERITPVIEEKKTLWKRIQNGLSDTMYDISEGAKDFIVWFVVNLPYLIIWGGIITIGVLVFRKFYRKNRRNTIQKNASAEDITNSQEK